MNIYNDKLKEALDNVRIQNDAPRLAIFEQGFVAGWEAAIAWQKQISEEINRNNQDNDEENEIPHIWRG